MKAWWVSEHGGNEVLKRRFDLDDPVPTEDEEKIRVRFVGLNHLDLWVRNGVPGHHFPLPLIPGCDVVGERANGERVVIFPVISCGNCERCVGDEPMLCRQFGLVGETRHGGAADYIVVPKKNVIPLPSSVSDEMAATLPIAGTTAWHMLHAKAKIKSGDWVLIQAASSGVSSLAIQIAKHAGAQIIACSRSEEKANQAKLLGAHHTIILGRGKFKDELKRILEETGKRGVDVVIDHVGKATFQDSIRSLDWGGRMVVCGATTGGEVTIDLKPLFFKNLSLMGSTMGGLKAFRSIISLAEMGFLKSTVNRSFSMDQLPEALSALESGEGFGKIILRAG